MTIRLTDDQVRQIRVEFSAGRSQRELAQLYGVAQNTVSSLVTGRTRVTAGGPVSRGTASKLSETDVLAIRNAAANGVPARDLAKRHGVSGQMISNITAGRAYQDLPGPIAGGRPARASPLTVAQVDEIVARSREGEARAVLAAAFGVSVWTIDSVRRGVTRGVDGGPRNSFSSRDVRSIRVRYSQGAKQTELAEEFSTSQQMISNIVRGDMYASYGGPIAGTSRRRFTSRDVRRIRDAAQVGTATKTIAEWYDTTVAIIQQVISEATYPTTGKE